MLEETMTPLKYLALRWHLLPIRPGTKVPLDGQGLKHATLDEDTVEGWCSRGCDWGIACSPSRIIVLDVDPRNGGKTTWEDLERRHGPLPDHPIQRTRNGGWHHVFADPGPCVGKLGPGVDVKRRGYIVAAPSSGYEWLVDPVADPPQLPWTWSVAVLKAKPAPPSAAPVPVLDGSGTRYGLTALEAECTALASEPEGGRNERLNIAAVKLGSLVAGGELEEASTRAALEQTALATGLTPTETAATIASGWRAGVAEPRRAPPLALAPKARICSPRDEEDEALPYSSVLGGEIPGPEDWRQGLTTKLVGGVGNLKRIVERTSANLALLLSHDKGWAGCLAWDELGNAATWLRAPPAIPGLATPAGRVRDPHITWVQHAARRAWGVSWPKAAVEDAMAAAAELNPVNPVREYLQGLVWDGTERLTGWLQTYLGAYPTVCPVGRWWLLSAVARVMRPGCQADHLLVLQGRQGAGKSTALRILGGEWYSGALGNLRDKDSAQSLVGVWMMEISELDALRGRAATEVKDFISRTTDHYRPSYGRYFVDRPRTCVFAGTTNEREYLADATGARRFWPVSVVELRRDELAMDRDQLWAEACQAYEDGERWWPAGTDEADALATAAEERYVQDPWEDVLAIWLDARAAMGESLEMSQILAAAGLEKGQQDMVASKRAAAILRRLGWERRLMRQGKRWVK